MVQCQVFGLGFEGVFFQMAGFGIDQLAGRFDWLIELTDKFLLAETGATTAVLRQDR